VFLLCIAEKKSPADTDGYAARDAGKCYQWKRKKGFPGTPPWRDMLFSIAGDLLFLTIAYHQKLLHNFCGMSRQTGKIRTIYGSFIVAAGKRGK